jgi:hypothetical protein
MPVTIGTKQRFGYSAKTMRYRDLTTGKFVKSKAVKADILRVEKAAGAEMRRLSQLLADRQLTLNLWQEQFAAELKLLHTSGAMAGAGGMAQMAPADYGRLGQELRYQYDRLNRFATQIEQGKVSVGELMRRTNMYVASIHKTFEGVRTGRAIGVFTYERNILSKHHHDRHCAVCIQQTQLGKVPIGTLIPIGQRTCMSHCKCRKVFSR